MKLKTCFYSLVILCIAPDTSNSMINNYAKIDYTRSPEGIILQLRLHSLDNILFTRHIRELLDPTYNRLGDPALSLAMENASIHIEKLQNERIKKYITNRCQDEFDAAISLHQKCMRYKKEKITYDFLTIYIDKIQNIIENSFKQQDDRSHPYLIKFFSQESHDANTMDLYSSSDSDTSDDEKNNTVHDSPNTGNLSDDSSDDTPLLPSLHPRKFSSLKTVQSSLPIIHKKPTYSLSVMRLSSKFAFYAAASIWLIVLYKLYFFTLAPRHNENEARHALKAVESRGILRSQPYCANMFFEAR